MHKEEKLVSIVLPVYNAEDYLDKCIGSLVGQTYQNIEIILVDDKSPDASPRICDAWAEKDSRVRVIHQEKNGGQSVARNTGMDHAAGDYIAFFDSDDFVEKTLVEKTMAKITAENAEIGWYGYNFYFGEDRTYPLYLSFPKEVYTGREIQEELVPDVFEASRRGKVKGLGGPPVWLYILSADFLRSTGLRFESEREWVFEDLLFNFYLFSKLNKAILVPEHLYYYNLTNTQSVTAKKFPIEKFFKMKKLFLTLFDKRKEVGYPDEVDLRLEDLFVSLTTMQVVKVVVNKAAYDDEEEFNGLLRTILSDDLFYQCLTTQSLNENFGKHMKDFLSLVVEKRIDECIASIVKNVQEDNDFLFSDETDSKE